MIYSQFMAVLFIFPLINLFEAECVPKSWKIKQEKTTTTTTTTNKNKTNNRKLYNNRVLCMLV